MALPLRTYNGDALCAALFALATVVVGIRLWTRKKIQNFFGVEDWLVIIATVLMWGFCCTLFMAKEMFHFGQHTDDLSSQEQVHAAWFVIITEFLYFLSSTSVKLAILLFYRRLGARTQARSFKIVLNLTMAEVIVSKLIYVVVLLCVCRPLSAFWLRQDPIWQSSHPQACQEFGASILVISSLSGVEDLVIAFIPGMILWNLQISRHQKAAVWSLFALSIGCGIASFVRTAVLYQAYYGPKDWILYLDPAWILTSVELGLGVICSSAPALKPFVLQYNLMAPAGRICKRAKAHIDSRKRLRDSAYASSTSLNMEQKAHSEEQVCRHSLKRPGFISIFDGSMSDGIPVASSFISSRKTSMGTTITQTVADPKPPGQVLEEVTELRIGERRKLSAPSRMWINIRRSIVVEERCEQEEQLDIEKQIDSTEHEISRLT